MKPHRIPSHASENPRLADGIYAAMIERVIEDTYGDDQPLVQVVFWLPDEEVHLVTNFYFPTGNSWKVQRRFWVLCQIVGLEPSDLVYEPDLFEGRRLRLMTCRVDPMESNVAWWYSDVNRFLPP